jgi:hypothetical protein
MKTDSDRSCGKLFASHDAQRQSSQADCSFSQMVASCNARANCQVGFTAPFEAALHQDRRASRTASGQLPRSFFAYSMAVVWSSVGQLSRKATIARKVRVLGSKCSNSRSSIQCSVTADTIHLLRTRMKEEEIVRRCDAQRGFLAALIC